MNTSLNAKNFLIELDAEATATRKCLQRIPAALFDYKPHPTSMSMGYLALLVAEIPLWITCMIEQGEIDFATFRHAEPKTTEELVAHFEKNLEGARQALQDVKDEQLQKPFYLKAGGKVLFTILKIDNLGPTLNHWVHHRGQLTVYMRLNEIPVPSIYGPSADDKSM